MTSQTLVEVLRDVWVTREGRYAPASNLDVDYARAAIAVTAERLGVQA